MGIPPQYVVIEETTTIDALMTISILHRVTSTPEAGKNWVNKGYIISHHHSPLKVIMAIMQLSWQVESIRPTPQLQVRFWSVEQPASFGCSPWCIKCSFAWHRPFVSQDICSRPSLLQRGCRTLLTSHLHAKVFRELVI